MKEFSVLDNQQAGCHFVRDVGGPDHRIVSRLRTGWKPLNYTFSGLVIALLLAGHSRKET